MIDWMARIYFVMQSSASKSMKLFPILALLQLPACAVIHFDNGPVIPDPDPHHFSFNLFNTEDEFSKLDASSSIRFNKWYHHGFYGIAEISNPLETTQVCTGLDWNQITTKTTPLDAAINLLDNVFFLYSSSAGVDLWSHWNIEYSCRNP